MTATLSQQDKDVEERIWNAGVLRLGRMWQLVPLADLRSSSIRRRTFSASAGLRSLEYRVPSVTGQLRTLEQNFMRSHLGTAAGGQAYSLPRIILVCNRLFSLSSLKGDVL